ncbi:MAG: hypothetical protein Q4B76_00750 [bacterium]|nr:hypothetical protein [bacterium]
MRTSFDPEASAETVDPTNITTTINKVTILFDIFFKEITSFYKEK